MVYIFGDAEMKGMVDAYDIAGDRWFPKKAMPQPRWSPAAVALGGAIYAIGGGDYPPTKAFGEVWRYDPGADSWTPESPMPTPRFQAAAVALAGKIYVVGGSDRTTWMSTVEVFEPGNGWTSAPPMSTGRAAAAAAVVGGKIYVAGGRDRASNTFASVEVYDPASGWGSAPPMPSVRRGHGAAALGSRLYVFGGCDGALRSPDWSLCGRYLSENEEFDPANSTWMPRAAMPGAAAYFASASAAGAAWSFGGEGNVTGAETFRYQPATLPVLDRATVEPVTATLAVGGKIGLTARALDSAGSEIAGASFSWSSSGAPGTLSGNSGPQVWFTAGSAGTAVVKVAATFGAKTGEATATIEVTAVPIDRITVEPGHYELWPGDLARLAASAYDVDGNPVPAAISWSVADPAIASLNASEGPLVAVTAKAPGTTVINARAIQGKVSREANATVIVRPPPDRFPPSVQILSPAGGSRVTGAFTVEGASAGGAGSPPVSLVEVRFDGGAWAAAAGTATWSQEVRPAELGWAPGHRAIEARAFDGSQHSEVAKVQIEFTPEDGGHGTDAAVPLWSQPMFLLLAILIVALVLGGCAVGAFRRRRSALSEGQRDLWR
jgi:hypothetical protein